MEPLVASVLKPTHSGHLPLLMPSTWPGAPFSLLSCPGLPPPGACVLPALWPLLPPDPGPRLELHLGCGFNLDLVHSASSSTHSWSAPPTLPYFGVQHNPGVRSAGLQIHWEADRVHMRSLGRRWAHCKLCVTAHQTLMAPS